MERTNAELADPIPEEYASRSNESLASLLLLHGSNLYLYREAAHRLREMPEGERIEGIVVHEYEDKFIHRITLEMRDTDMADPTGYARATLYVGKE